MSIVVTASVDNFFKLAKHHSVNRCKSDVDHLCYGTNQFLRVKELFENFRQKHPNFNYCSSSAGYDHGQFNILTCLPTDNSAGHLISAVINDGKKLVMSIQKNKVKYFEDDVEKNMAAGFEGLLCISNPNTGMRCNGTGVLSSYSLTVTDNSCTETVGSQNESCDQKLSLFEPLLKSTPEIPRQVAPNPSNGPSGSNNLPLQDVFATVGWKNAIGAVSALGFAYLAYKEARAWQKETREVHPKGKEQHPKASGWRALSYAGLATGSAAFALLS